MYVIYNTSIQHAPDTVLLKPESLRADIVSQVVHVLLNALPSTSSYQISQSPSLHRQTAQLLPLGRCCSFS